MDEARGVFLLLPDLVAQRARFLLAHVGDELVDRAEHFVERLGAHFVTRQLVNLARQAREMRHGKDSNGKASALGHFQAKTTTSTVNVVSITVAQTRSRR